MTRFLVLVITEAEHLVEIGAAFMDRDRCCFGGVRGRFSVDFAESKQLLHVMSINESPVESCIYVGAVSRTAAAAAHGIAITAITALGRHSMCRKLQC